MRYLWNDRLDFYSGQDLTTVLLVKEVEIPTAGGVTRDLWFRLEKAVGLYPGTSTLDIYAYRTRAEAKTEPNPPATYVALKTGITDLGDAEITLDDNAGEPPTMTGLKVSIWTAADSDQWRAAWGYTSEIGVVAVDNIVSLLKTYIGTGLALSDLDTSRIIGHVADDAWIYKKPPAIYVSVGPAQAPKLIVTGFAVHLPLVVRAHTLSLKDPAEAYRTARSLQERISTILFDEQRTLYGMVNDVQFVSMEPPREVVAAGESAWTFLETVTTGLAVFPHLWQDRVYPRTA